jgi:O-antigen/teichoic acid export membrane protein
MVVAVLVAGRMLGLIIHLVICIKVTPWACHRVAIRQTVIWPLLYFGSWMALTNMIQLIISYIDRFLIGSLVSLAAVAYYATPYEMVANLFVIPGSIIKVLFPAFATTFVQNTNCTENLFDRGMKYIFLSIFPMILTIVVFAREALSLWLGSEFVIHSTFVMQVISFGVYTNSMVQPAFALIQGAGRPDLTAKLAVLLLPFYTILLWKSIAAYGIQGAAIVWTGKQILDAMFLLFMVRQFIPDHFSFLHHAILPFAPVLLILFLGTTLNIFIIKLVFFVLTLLFVTGIFWIYILNEEEQNRVISFLKAAFPIGSSNVLYRLIETTLHKH